MLDWQKQRISYPEVIDGGKQWPTQRGPRTISGK